MAGHADLAGAAAVECDADLMFAVYVWLLSARWPLVSAAQAIVVGFVRLGAHCGVRVCDGALRVEPVLRPDDETVRPCVRQLLAVGVAGGDAAAASGLLGEKRRVTVSLTSKALTGSFPLVPPITFIARNPLYPLLC